VSRRNRLSRSRDFDAVYRSGRSVSTRYLTLYAFVRPDSEDDGDPRLGLAVSRQVGGAVVRNRLKRQLRECFAELRDGLPRGCDYVLIARPGLAESAERRGYEWLRERVAEIFGIARTGDAGSSSDAVST
jgi:ribonuclease P protein component